MAMQRIGGGGLNKQRPPAGGAQPRRPAPGGTGGMLSQQGGRNGMRQAPPAPPRPGGAASLGRNLQNANPQRPPQGYSPKLGQRPAPQMPMAGGAWRPPVQGSQLDTGQPATPTLGAYGGASQSQLAERQAGLAGQDDVAQLHPGAYATKWNEGVNYDANRAGAAPADIMAGRVDPNQDQQGWMDYVTKLQPYMSSNTISTAPGLGGRILGNLGAQGQSQDVSGSMWDRLQSQAQSGDYGAQGYYDAMKGTLNEDFSAAQERTRDQLAMAGLATSGEGYNTGSAYQQNQGQYARALSDMALKSNIAAENQFMQNQNQAWVQQYQTNQALMNEQLQRDMGQLSGAQQTTYGMMQNEAAGGRQAADALAQAESQQREMDFMRSQQDTGTDWGALAGSVLGTAGTVAGAMFGGPPGAMAGGAAGQGLGSIVGGLAGGSGGGGSGNLAGMLRPGAGAAPGGLGKIFMKGQA